MSISLVTIKKRDGEDINSLLKRFKRKVETSNHLNELKDRKYYIKPSLEKRERLNKVQHKIKKDREKELERLLLNSRRNRI